MLVGRGDFAAGAVARGADVVVALPAAVQVARLILRSADIAGDRFLGTLL